MTKEMAIDILRGGVLGTNEQTHEAVFMAIKALKEQVEVVRCKDCKWWKAEKQECYEWYDSPYAPADGYCFRAERREE